MSVIDFNSQIRYSPMVCSHHFGVEHARGTVGFFADHRSSAISYLPQMCSALSGRALREVIPLPRSVSSYRICSANPSREPSGYRILSACPKQQALPYGHAINNYPEYSGRRERAAKLGNPRRICPIADQDCTSSLRRRRSRYRARKYRLRSRRIHDRSLPFPFPMGVVPLHQVSGKTAHPIRFTWKYPYLHPYLRRKASWCQCSWHSPSWARSFLHYGPWSMLTSSDSLLWIKLEHSLWSGPSETRGICNDIRKQLTNRKVSDATRRSY